MLLKTSIYKRLSENPPSQVRQALEKSLLALLDGDKASAVEYYQKADRREMIACQYNQPSRWLVGTEDITLLDDRY